MTDRIARVVVVSPLPTLDHLFDYRIPDRLVDDARVGVRVKVPFGNRKRLFDGFIVEIVADVQAGVTAVDIEKVVSPVPVLAPRVWALARAVADRQAGVAADVLRLAVPPRHAREEKEWSQGIDLDALDESHVPLPPSFEPDTAPAPAPVPAPAPADRIALLVRAGGAWSAGQWHPIWALDVARRARALWATGRRMIVIVPDQRDIIAVSDALAADAPELSVARLDASGDAGSRYRSFLSVLDGSAAVVLGNRQAVYAPAPNLGCIYVWEDADSSHAEPHAPYAHVRDVAMLRNHQENVSLIFGSHSRSTAVQRLVEMQWLGEQQLGDAASIIPSGQMFGGDDGRAGIPEPVWRLAREALDADAPVLIQVARRGYARVLLCEDCHTPAHCSRCGGPLGLPHHESSVPQCRWCGRDEVGFRCGVCGCPTFRQASPGVERTSRDIGRAFPTARIVTSTGSAAVARVARARTVVLAVPGVEPIADGGYGLVILLDCEWMLGREGLTAVEDAVRQWFTAAALVAPTGRVVAMGVEGRLARALNVWRPDVFATDELASRRAAKFPPAQRVCAVTGPLGSTRRVIELAQLKDGVTVIGTVPVPAEHDDLSGTLRERTLMTMPYAMGTEAALALKAASMRAPQRFRDWGIARTPGATSPIRVRFDDVESL